VVDSLPIVVPVGIRGSPEDVGDVAPVSPRAGNCGNQSRPLSAGHRDGDLLAFLNAANQIRRVLTQLTQTNDFQFDG
jgi:hypothetical protein